MAMTRQEKLAKDQVMTVLSKEGYPTYANLLDLFHFNLTEDPNVVAYMEPGKGRIVVNSGLDIDQVSTIVRHEILHEYLNHHKRLLNKLAKEHNLDPDELDDLSIKELEKEIFSDDTFNIAGDYEISNRGYTDKDKRIARSIKLNGQKLKGLVTEDDHPDWVDLSIEDMYDKLREIRKQDQQQNKNGDSNNDDSKSGKDSNSQSSDSSSDSDNQDSSSSSNSSKSSNGIRIGDKGSKEIQDAEEAARQAADVTKELEDSPAKSEMQDEIKDLEDKIDNTSEDRLEKIKKALNDINQQANAMRELEDAISRDEIAKADKESDKYRNNPLNKFILDLNKFIKNEVETGKGKTWKRFNRKYQDSGIIRAGKSRLTPKNIPSINVYFDMSGSWDESKIEVGKRAIASLNKYVQKGVIKIKLFYFSNYVVSSPDDHSLHGGTEGQPIIDHIVATKPDNVIVMTDSDIRDITDGTVVDGAVWFLFKGGESNNLIQNLKGRRHNKKFDI